MKLKFGNIVDITNIIILEFQNGYLFLVPVIFFTPDFNAAVSS